MNDVTHPGVWHLRRRKGAQMRENLEMMQLEQDALARAKARTDKPEPVCKSEEERQLLRGLILKACGRL